MLLIQHIYIFLLDYMYDMALSNGTGARVQNGVTLASPSDYTHPGNFRTVSTGICFKELRQKNIKPECIILPPDSDYYRIALINGNQLWFPLGNSSSKINIYDLNCKLLAPRVNCVAPAPEDSARTIIQRKNGKVQMCCESTGFSELKSNGLYMREVICQNMVGCCSTMAVNDNLLFLMCSARNLIYICKDTIDGKLSPINYFEVPGLNKSNRNTMVATNEHLYVSMYAQCMLYVYDIRKDLTLSRLSMRSFPFPDPMLCGVDYCGHILAISESQHMLYCIDSELKNHWEDVTPGKLMDPISDAVLDREQNLWIFSISTTKRKVLKFS